MRSDRPLWQAAAQGAGPRTLRLAIFLGHFSGVAIERSTIKLAAKLAESGLDLDLVIAAASEPTDLAEEAGVRVVRLPPRPAMSARASALRAWPAALRDLAPVLVSPHPTLTHLPALAGYLRAARPDVLLANGTYANITALLARSLVHGRSKLIVVERIALSAEAEGRGRARYRRVRPLVRRLYGHADALVAVSCQAADDLAQFAALPRERIRAIYNAVVSADLRERSEQSVHHPWFEDRSRPVLLAVGRLHRQKDYPTLLRAFARVRQARPSRLMILGGADSPDATHRQIEKLQALARELGVASDLALPGPIENPLPYMRRAAALVLSSAWEGLPTVLIEALFCGSPVVSTACPGGPAEILDHGRYGRLVPVGDDLAMAERILQTLAEPADREALRSRAAMFSVDAAAKQYRQLVEAVATTPN